MRSLYKIAYNKGQVLGSYGIKFIGDLPLKLGSRNRMAVFECFCGGIFECRIAHIQRDHTTNCGCIPHGTKHGFRFTPAYLRWKAILERCYNPKRLHYDDYGGRGITMYPLWVNDPKAFCEYVMSLPHYGEPGMTLDRIENNGDYEPGNLRWTTQYVQIHNRRGRVR